jgi:recombination protein RecA
MDADKKKRLEEALSQIDKDHGKGTIMRLGDKPALRIPVIPTGSYLLDHALGVGGFPKGRIIEIYGPESSGKTSISLIAIAQAQKAGGTCAFIDIEHSLDSEWASKLGVDLNNLYISQPDTGEDALEILDTLTQTSALDIIVIDSVAALVPKAELEGDMGDAQMGAQARLMSQAMRKLAGVISKSNTCVIFLNQIRHAIGVMFGCFHSDTLVNFVDGRRIRIKKVVEDKIKGKVWSYNEALNSMVPSNIIGWHYNGKVNSDKDFINIHSKAIGGNGRLGITVTKDHRILTKEGWKEAKKITKKDYLVSKYKSIINGSLSDFLWGTLIGDSFMAPIRRSSACLSFRDTTNPEYLEWKIKKLSNSIKFNLISCHRYHSISNYEFFKIREELGKRDPVIMLKNHFSDMGLAVWVMDDGHLAINNQSPYYCISVTRFKNNLVKLKEIKEALKEIGLSSSFGLNTGRIFFNKKESLKIASRISKYVPKCMEYKLPDEFKGKYIDFSLSNTEIMKKEYVKVISIKNANKKQMECKGRYDLTVENKENKLIHNYLVGSMLNGVVAHNSPERVTGGNALKFYASVRIDARRKENILKGEEVIGNDIQITVKKNKVAPPFRKVIIPFYYYKGYDPQKEMIDLAVQVNIIEKSGTWYSYKGERLAQGKDNSADILRGDSKLFNEIEAKVKQVMSVGAEKSTDKPKVRKVESKKNEKP